MKHLRFMMDNDAPKEFVKKWEVFRSVCEGDKEINNEVSVRWTELCRLASNRALPILHRCEGGLGGNSNGTDKQIRYRMSLDPLRKLDDHILIYLYDSDDGTDVWTDVEIRDLLNAFAQLANEEYGCGGGCRGILQTMESSESWDDGQ